MIYKTDNKRPTDVSAISIPAFMIFVSLFGILSFVCTFGLAQQAWSSTVTQNNPGTIYNKI